MKFNLDTNCLGGQILTLLPEEVESDNNSSLVKTFCEALAGFYVDFIQKTDYPTGMWKVFSEIISENIDLFLAYDSIENSVEKLENILSQEKNNKQKT